MIIDFRLRPPVKPYLSGRIYNLERNKRLSESMGMYQSPSVLNYSMDMLLDEMDEAGVSIGVVPGRESNPGMGDATCEEVTSIVQSHPGRFVGIAGVDPTKPDEAFSRIEQFVVNGILKAVCLEPGALPEPLYGDDRILYPVIEYCAARDIPVMMMLGGNAGPDVSYTNPVQIDHVAADFPSARFIISHGGWPWVQEVLHVAFRRPNIYISPDMYLFNMPGWQDYVTACNFFLQDRFLFGTAYPFLPLKGCVEHFMKLPFKPEVLPKLLYRNAAALLNIDC